MSINDPYGPVANVYDAMGERPTESQEAPSDLPELPESVGDLCSFDSVRIMREPGYTADQMRAYATEATNYYRHLLRAANARGDGGVSDAIEAALYRVQEYMHTYHDFLVPIDEYIDGSQQPTTEEICQGNVTITTTPESN